MSKQISVCEQEKKDLIVEGTKFSEEIGKLRQELRKVKGKVSFCGHDLFILVDFWNVKHQKRALFMCS